MLEQLLPIFLGYDSRLRELGETIFKLILTITIAIGTWTALIHPGFHFMFSDLQDALQFLFSPSFLLLSVLFILYCYLFYSVIPLITFLLFLRIVTKALSTKPKPESDKSKNLKPPSRIAIAIIDIFAWLGILSRTGMAIGVGPIIPLMINRIKESFTSDKNDSLPSEITSPYVVLEFGVVYLWYIAPSLHVPVIFTVVVILLGLFLFLFGLLVEFFARSIRLFREQITQLLVPLTQILKVGQQIGKIDGQA